MRLVDRLLISTRSNQFNREGHNRLKFVHPDKKNKDDYSLNTEIGRAKIVEKIESCRITPSLIFIDTLTSFLDDHSVVKAKRAINFLNELAERYNCHIIICHHPRKMSPKKKMDLSDVSGGSAITRLVSAVFTVQNVYDEAGNLRKNFGRVSLIKEWSSMDSFEYSICDVGKWVEIKYNYNYSEGATSKLNIAKQSILDLFQESPKLKSIEIKSRLKDSIKENTIKTAMYALEKDGIIIGREHTKNRYYELAEIVLPDATDADPIDVGWE